MNGPISTVGGSAHWVQVSDVKPHKRKESKDKGSSDVSVRLYLPTLNLKLSVSWQNMSSSVHFSGKNKRSSSPSPDPSSQSDAGKGNAYNYKSTQTAGVLNVRCSHEIVFEKWLFSTRCIYLCQVRTIRKRSVLKSKYEHASYRRYNQIHK